MQVHAVPETERAYDSSGRRLPWGYEFADAEPTKRRIPEEKGPFGKARKRGTSRSKTATPARTGQDQAKLENQRIIDDIFLNFGAKAQETQKESRLRKSSGSAGLPGVSASAPNLLEAAQGAGGLGESLITNGTGSTTANGANAVAKEPTEVMLWGYGNDVQWAAIDYFEKVSGGLIYEEYDRCPPNSRYDLSLSRQKSLSLRSLSKSCHRKINEYVGGDHWIKVTFDSPEAAERACHYSPHVIQGYVVTAQRYVGRGPNEDKAVRAHAGSRFGSTMASPQSGTTSSHTLPWDKTSTTLSSATATAPSRDSLAPRMASGPQFRATGSFPVDDLDDPDATIVPTAPPQTSGTLTSASRSAATTSYQAPSGGKLRIKGAKPAVLLPPEKAFLPAASRWQQTFGSWPVVGWIIGSDHGIIGDSVPRKEDGSFDSEKASLYWRVWYNVDCCFGTDFCGVREVEMDD